MSTLPPRSTFVTQTELDQSNEVQSEIYKEINPNDTLVRLAAARRGIQPEQLVALKRSDYLNKFKYPPIANMLYDIHDNYQQQLYQQINEEQQNIINNGILIAEFLLFDEDPALEKYINSKPQEVEINALSKFQQQLITEASQVRQELLKKLKTMASIERKNEQLRSAVQLSDKEIAARQAQELKDRKKIEQNHQRVEQFSLLQRTRHLNNEIKIQQHSQKAEKNYNDIMAEKVKKYQEKVNEHLERAHQMQMEREAMEYVKQQQIIKSFKKPTEDNFNSKYILQQSSPFREKQRMLQTHNQLNRTNMQKEQDERLIKTMNEINRDSTRKETIVKKKALKNLPFQLKINARQNYAREYVKAKEKEKQTIGIRRFEQSIHDQDIDATYSQYRRMIGKNEQVDKEKQRLFTQKLKEEHKAARKMQEQQKYVEREKQEIYEKERKHQYQERLKKIKYIQNQLKFQQIGSLEYNQLYFQLTAMLDELKTDYT